MKRQNPWTAILQKLNLQHLNVRSLTRKNAFALAAIVLGLVTAGVNAQQRAPWGGDSGRYENPNSRYNDQKGSQWPSDRFNSRPERNVPGVFDYYALVLSWSPSYCSGAGESSNSDQQCNRADGRRFSFVVHGLWPQYEKGYPEMCRMQRKPYVPQPLIDRTLDIMPSTGLIIHEYRKHGACSGLMPEAYFSTTRQLFNSIKIPEQFKNPFEAQFVSPSEVVTQFTRINPQLKPDMMGVACGGAGNRLKEIRFCFTKDGKPRSCGSNEDQRRLCSSDRMFVPPVRSTAREDQGAGAGGKGQPPTGSGGSNQIPRPRLIEGPHGI